MYRIFTYTFTFETTQRWYMRYVGNNPSFAPLIWLIFLESQMVESIHRPMRPGLLLPGLEVFLLQQKRSRKDKKIKPRTS